MSATAKAWASTHNETLYTKMTSVVDVLYACQKAIGTGYLSAFPDELFDRFEAVKAVWAPYYTIHKVRLTYKNFAHVLVTTLLLVSEPQLYTCSCSTSSFWSANSQAHHHTHSLLKLQAAKVPTL
jgi:Beta-L-arabinofuranosidase, GH127